MTPSTTLPAPEGASRLKAMALNPQTRQKLLAFASLIVLMVFFSLASPNFLQTENIVAILQATAVNGVLAIACTFVPGKPIAVAHVSPLFFEMNRPEPVPAKTLPSASTARA